VSRETSKSIQGNAGAHGDRENPDSLLSHRFQFKITDFGLAKFVEDHADPASGATIAGDIMGTAAYMSPEQARGDSPKSSPASDIYSLGAILYELLTGRAPFVGARPIDVLAQVVADEPVRPSQLVRRMPADLQTICLKCLEKNPLHRYSSALILAEELARFQSNLPITGSGHARGGGAGADAIRLPCFNGLNRHAATHYFGRDDGVSVVSKISLSKPRSPKWPKVPAASDVAVLESYLPKPMPNAIAVGSVNDWTVSPPSNWPRHWRFDQIDEQSAKLREVAIVCLALPDALRRAHSRGCRPRTSFISTSIPLEPLCVFDRSNHVIVKDRVNDRTIVDLGPFSDRTIHC
jgi:serine/threonine protein kinase